MSEIDKLLAQLKTEYEKPAPSQAAAKETPTPKIPIKSPSQSASPLDSLLAEIKAEFAPQENSPKQQSLPETPKTSPSVTPTQPKLEHKLSWESEKPQPKHKPIPDVPRRSPPPGKIENSVLQDLQAEFQEQERAESQRREVQLKEQQRLEEQRQQRRRQALQQQAQEWLKRLNPKSEEGKWFEEFSYSYESKLEAAIDYLEALRESGLNR